MEAPTATITMRTPNRPRVILTSTYMESRESRERRERERERERGEREREREREREERERERASWLHVQNKGCFEALLDCV